MRDEEFMRKAKGMRQKANDFDPLSPNHTVPEE
jgi:hypothetical protein